MLFLGIGAVALSLTVIVGGWAAYQQFWNNDDETRTTESEVPAISYYSDAEWFSEPQAGIKYLVEDEDQIDLGGTLDAVMDWVREDDPNIFTGDFKVTVTTWNDIGLVEINGDASTMIEPSYDDVELPYVDGANNFNTVEIDLTFA